jgi:hypothetical protein
MIRRKLTVLGCFVAVAGVVLASQSTRVRDAERVIRPVEANPAAELPTADFLELQAGAQKQPTGEKPAARLRTANAIANPVR